MRAAIFNLLWTVWQDAPWLRPYMIGGALAGIVWAWFVVNGLRALVMLYQ